MTEISDEQLFDLFRNGDEAAFARLLRRYEKPLYNFLLKFLRQPGLAEDVFQETFLQVHISAESFQSSRRFRPWLYTIASNKARDLLRSRARRPTVQLTASDDNDDPGQLLDSLLRDNATPQQILEKKQQREIVHQAVAQMPEHLREILVLAYFKYLSYKELSEHLDVPLGTVKSRLHSAVANFSNQYNELVNPDERSYGG
ncbi:MAG: sigma-70 family RNA polymerase sigma factor [Sedimentisphaerales bacterium]|nr:sigma-70 family RNA polymerase sigma factor [Sedimentisphaerales bacterium]